MENEVQTLNAQETNDILNKFYNDSLSFWNREKELGKINDSSPEELALNDVKPITTNPFSPNGKLLDSNTKEQWMFEKRAVILGINNPGDAYEEALTIQENYGLLSNTVQWNNKDLLNLLKSIDPKEHEKFLFLKELHEKKQINQQSEIDNLKKQLGTMKTKLNTVEKFFNQDKAALRSFNRFLNTDKTINSPDLENKEKELVASNKKKNGLEL